VIAQGSLFEFDAKSAKSAFETINLRKRPVRARTAARILHSRAETPRDGVRHRPRRHRQDLARGGARRATVRAQGSRPHHPVAARVEAGERLGFLPGICARRSILICGRFTTRCTI